MHVYEIEAPKSRLEPSEETKFDFRLVSASPCLACRYIFNNLDNVLFVQSLKILHTFFYSEIKFTATENSCSFTKIVIAWFKANVKSYFSQPPTCGTRGSGKNFLQISLQVRVHCIYYFTPVLRSLLRTHRAAPPSLGCRMFIFRHVLNASKWKCTKMNRV